MHGWPRRRIATICGAEPVRRANFAINKQIAALTHTNLGRFRSSWIILLRWKKGGGGSSTLGLRAVIDFFNTQACSQQLSLASSSLKWFESATAGRVGHVNRTRGIIELQIWGIAEAGSSCAPALLRPPRQPRSRES